jgi:phage/plasmid-associated DNA primase
LPVAISVHVIEFPRKFAEHEMDVELTEKLVAEFSGIFNWSIGRVQTIG